MLHCPAVTCVLSLKIFVMPSPLPALVPADVLGAGFGSFKGRREPQSKRRSSKVLDPFGKGLFMFVSKKLLVDGSHPAKNHALCEQKRYMIQTKHSRL